MASLAEFLITGREFEDVGHRIEQIMNSPAWSEASIIVIVWDEADNGGDPKGCCNSPTGTKGTLGDVPGAAVTPAIVIRRGGGPGHRQSSRHYNHYSLLGTIQRLWNLPCLVNTCAGANLIWTWPQPAAI